MSPTNRTAAIAALLALSALWLPLTVVGLAAVALFVLALVDLRAVGGHPDVERTISSPLSRGLPEPLRVEVDAPPATTVTIRQAVPPDLAVDPPVAEERLDAEVTAKRRGRHTLPGAATRAQGPLGLAARYRTSPDEAELDVFPDMPAARRLAMSVRQGGLRDPGLRPRGPLGLGTEFESVRDYLPDDDIRQVNWAATQRMGKPMSNQYRLERDRDLMLMVDMGRLMAAEVEGRTRLDASMDVVAAVCLVAEELGDRCGAIAFDDGIRTVVKPSRRGSRHVINQLYDVEPSGSDSDYERAFSRVERGRRAFVLVLTDIVDEAAARPLMAAMPMVARHHAVAVASVVDPALDRATRDPEVPLDAYRMAVAYDVLAARSLVGARIRALGAQMVEAPAGSLAAACVRAYVTAKMRARL